MRVGRALEHREPLLDLHDPELERLSDAGFAPEAPQRPKLLEAGEARSELFDEAHAVLSDTAVLIRRRVKT